MKLYLQKVDFKYADTKQDLSCFEELDVLSGWLESFPGAGDSCLRESDKK
jgi:hypothetical protein